jgi:undecaprenyl diphosphate synthase
MSDNPAAPRHIGLILDGNRRWAKQRGLPTMKGHKAGYDILRDLAIYTLKERKIQFLSAYVFSTENWQRAEEEVGYLMRLVHRALSDYLDEFHRNNIRIVVLGSRDRLSKKLIEAIETAETRTADNDGGTLALCFNYGGHYELTEAVNKLLQSKRSSVTAEDIAQALYHPEVPPVDLIIRTSGEQRLSGFMLARAAYSELLFLPKFWPDFTKQDIDDAIDEFKSRQRRYGA